MGTQEVKRELGDKYEITGHLGKGGMAVIYKGLQKPFDRPVAIKVISPEICEDENLTRRFLQEIQILSQLNHPNIVTVIEPGQLNDGSFYLVMEYLEGRTLEDIRKKGSVRNYFLLIQWAKQIVKAISYAHSKGIIHRDIKPDNVMVISENHIKVMDFGIARAEWSPQLTQHSVIGTPAYMSPEQCKGDEISHLTDIYSLGCLLYAMITGEPPFGGLSDKDNSMKIMQKHIKEQPVLISTLVSETPAELVDLIHRMLEKKPENRPSDPKEIIEELQTIEQRLSSQNYYMYEAFKTIPSLHERILQNRTKPFDQALLDFIIPGFGFMLRAEYLKSAIFILLNVICVFLPYPVMFSLLLRAAVSFYSYISGKKIKFQTALDFLWFNRRTGLISIFIIWGGVIFTVFAIETNKRKAGLAVPVQKPAVKKTASPVATYIPERESETAPAKKPPDKKTENKVSKVKESSVLDSLKKVIREKPVETPEPEKTKIREEKKEQFTSLSMPQFHDIAKELASREKREKPKISQIRPKQTPTPLSLIPLTESELESLTIKKLRNDDKDSVIRIYHHLLERPENTNIITLRMVTGYYYNMRDMRRYSQHTHELNRDWIDDIRILNARMRKGNSDAVINIIHKIPFWIAERLITGNNLEVFKYIDNKEIQEQVLSQLKTGSLEERMTAFLLLLNTELKPACPYIAAMMPEITDVEMIENFGSEIIMWLEKYGDKSVVEDIQNTLEIKEWNQLKGVELQNLLSKLKKRSANI